MKVKVYEKIKIMNLEPWGWVWFHPIQKNSKTRFLDGALMGAGSFKPRKKKGNFTKHTVSFPI